MIDYDDSTHTYSYRGRRYLSATQLIEHFSHEFKTKEQAEAYAYKHGQTAEYWMEQWNMIRDRSLRRGNRIHNQREDLIFNRSMDVAFGKPRRVQNIALYPDTPLSELPDGIYPELMVWDHRYGIAGRSDKIILESEPTTHLHMAMPLRRAHIEDYKTNRFIKMKSWMEKDGSFKMMKVPLTDVMDCDWWHYQLQLSLYMFMLEYHGFRPGRMQIIHFPHIPAEAPPGATDPPTVTYPCLYLRDHVTSMLDHLKRKHIL
jgi:hypothetical protein